MKKYYSLFAILILTLSVKAQAGLIVTLTPIDESPCSSTFSGAISSIVTGGVPPYHYLWSGGDTTQDITGLPAGNYSLTVSDSNGSSATASASVAESAPMKVKLLFAYPTCHGRDDGFCVLDSITGGAPPYSLLWSTGSTKDTITGLQGGTSVSINVNDNEGCSLTYQFQITDPPLPVFSAGNDTAISSDVTTLNGSVSPNTYTGYWHKLSGSGVITDSANAHTTVTGLTTGSSQFIWKVENAGGCTYSDTVTLTVTLTGIMDIKHAASLFNIYPNPNKGVFEILFNYELAGAGLQIFNSIGQIIYHANISSGIEERKISLTDQPEGIYFIQVVSTEGLQTKKIVLAQ